MKKFRLIRHLYVSIIRAIDIFRFSKCCFGHKQKCCFTAAQSCCNLVCVLCHISTLESFNVIDKGLAGMQKAIIATFLQGDCYLYFSFLDFK